MRPEELSTKSAAAGPQVTDAVEAESAAPSTTAQQFRPTVSPSTNPITIDADIVRGKEIKSIEVNCKIEYS